MKHVAIFDHDGGATERWLYVMADGTVQCHVANSGPRLLRRGAEAHDEVLTPADAAWRWPEHAQAIRLALDSLGWDVTTMIKIRDT